MRSIGKGAPRTLARVPGILLGSAILLGILSSSPRSLRAQEQGTVPTLTPERVLTLAKGDRPAEAREPYRALLAADGRIYLTDSRKGDVLWFDRNLVWKGNLAPLHPQGSLGEPVRTVVDSQGRILVADSKSRQIFLFRDGAYAGAWGGRGDPPGQFRSLDDIAVDADDMVYAADADRGAIYVFTPEGLLERVVSGFEGVWFVKPALVALDPGGGAVRVRRVSQAGPRRGSGRVAPLDHRPAAAAGRRRNCTTWRSIRRARCSWRSRTSRAWRSSIRRAKCRARYSGPPGASGVSRG